jgi:hypothetical protein
VITTLTKIAVSILSIILIIACSHGVVYFATLISDVTKWTEDLRIGYAFTVCTLSFISVSSIFTLWGKDK